MSQTNERPDVSTLSYEQAKEELVEVVRRLETGATTLEDSLALWERGEALAARCQDWLDGARERLDAAHAATDGPRTTTEGNRAADTETTADREATLDDAAAGIPEEDDR